MLVCLALLHYIMLCFTSQRPALSPEQHCRLWFYRLWFRALLLLSNPDAGVYQRTVEPCSAPDAVDRR